MKKKEKLMLSVILIGIGTGCNLFFTAALHGLLSKQQTTLILFPFSQCIRGLWIERQQLFLFLVLEGFLILCCVVFCVQNSRPYQSELVKVAGDIYTPASVGQYQHGSSRWLKEEEWDQAFQTQIIDPHNRVIKMLLDTGYDNLSNPIHQEKGKEGDTVKFVKNVVTPAKISLKKVEQVTQEGDPYKLFSEGGIVVGRKKKKDKEKEKEKEKKRKRKR